MCKFIVFGSFFSLFLLFSCEEGKKSEFLIFDIDSINESIKDSTGVDLYKYSETIELNYPISVVQDSVIGENVAELKNFQPVIQVLDSLRHQENERREVSRSYIIEVLLKNIIKGEGTKEVQEIRHLVEKTKVSDYIVIYESGGMRLRTSRFLGLITDLNSKSVLSEKELYYLLAIWYILSRT